MANLQVGAPPRESLKPGADTSREPSDQTLLERFIACGDEAAFAGLVQRHGKTVWGVCWRVLRQEQDVEDAFQAVFLVLARKAASIRTGEAVGSWLYGVAYRTAMKARRSAARRHSYEQRVAPSSQEKAEPWAEEAGRELQRLLDEEVQRLAEKYRAPFVLCCLEGMSRSEAARELKWKEGTLSGRLARARDLLQTRLARRGVILSAALTAAALAENTTFAAAQPILIPATIKGGLATLVGTKPVGVSASALQLAEAVSRTVTVAKLKTAMLVFLALAMVISGLGLAALQFAPAADISDPDTFVGPPTPFGTPDLVTLPPDVKPIHALAYAPDGTFVAVATKDTAVQIRDAKTGDVVQSLSGHSGEVNCLAFSPDGRTLASGSSDTTVKLWNLATGKTSRTLKGHTGEVYALAFIPDGTRLASAGSDKGIRLWQVESGQPLAALAGHDKAVRALAVAPDGRTLVSGGDDQTIKTWDLSDAGRIANPSNTLKGHTGAVRALVITLDGTLASASEDGTIKLWKLAQGQDGLTLKGHTDAVLALAVTPTGRTLVSGSRDKTVRVWDCASGEVRASLRRHRGAVTALAVHPRGKDLISGGVDSWLFRWPGAAKKPTPPAENKAIKATSPPEMAAVPAPTEPVAELLEDNTAFFIDNLNNPGAGDASIAERDERSFFSGACSLAVSEFQRFNPRMPNWKYEIAENPRPGQYRYVRFAWKRTEAPGIMLQLHAWPRTWHRYYAGTVSAATQSWGLMTRIADDPPRRWELVTRDLFKDFGPMTITGIGFSAMEGPGQANFDHIYLGRTIEDLDQVSARLKGVTDDADDGSGSTVWLVTGAIVALTGSLLLVWLYGRRRRHASNTPGPVGVEGKQTNTGAASPAGVSFACPGCARKLKARAEIAGKKIRCPGCGTETIVPQTSASGVRPSDGSQGGAASQSSSAVSSRLPMLLWLPALGMVATLGAAIALWFAAGADARDSDSVSVPGKQADFFQDFRGGRPMLSSLKMVGPDADSVITPEDGGLRITLPATRAVNHPVEVVTKFSLTGDFEITGSYELLSAGRPAKGYGAGVSLNVATDPGRRKFAKVSRLLRPREGSVHLSEFWTNDPPKDYQVRSVPAEARAGKLRLVRQGSTIRFLAADGTTDDFREIYQRDFGTEELADVRFQVCDSGSPGNAVDARLVDLKVRSDNLTLDNASDATRASEHQDRRGWRILSVLALLLALALAAWLGVRCRTGKMFAGPC